jgi:large subunit ribosomal protein L15
MLLKLDTKKLMERLTGSLRGLHMGNLSPAPGSNKPKKRVGRGRALGGRFCGRGAAGQKSRSGAGMPRGFAGGQTPLHISTPKYGFTNV